MMTKENIFGGKLYDENMQTIWHTCGIVLCKTCYLHPTPIPLTFFSNYSLFILNLALPLAITQSKGAFTLLTSRFLKSRHFDPTIYTCAKNREVSVSRNFTIFWLVVRMCDHRLQCMHSCMQRMQYAWGPRIYRRKYPRSRDEMSRHFCGYHLHWLTSLETSRHFRKIALRLAIFLAMFRECLCIVARQLAPKCRDFSNVAKLASRCKWP